MEAIYLPPGAYWLFGVDPIRGAFVVPVKLSADVREFGAALVETLEGGDDE